MKVLLIDPPFYTFMGMGNRYFPIGLGYLAASLKEHGHEVKIFSPDSSNVVGAPDYNRMHDRYKIFIREVNNASHPMWQEILRVIRDFSPRIVGITAMTPKIASVLKTASICKGYNDKIDVIVGGPHATIRPQELLQYKDIDWVIRGEGEVSFVKLNAFEKRDSLLFISLLALQ